MIGILFATDREAEPFLSAIGARQRSGGRLKCYDAGVFDPTLFITVISGMGKVAAAMASGYLVSTLGATTVISAGLCGLLNRGNGRNVGDLFTVQSAVEGDCDRFGEREQPVDCDGRWFSDLQSVRLVTCDRPVFDAEQRAELGKCGDLIDMEGAAVARVADFYGIRCAMVKGVSDNADVNGRDDITANIGRVSRKVADVLIAALKTTTEP